MPLRAPKMYGFILGFHRLVWWPKWTPASSRFFMVTSVIRAACSIPPFLQVWTKGRAIPESGPETQRTSLVHRIQELLIRLGAANLVVQEFHRFHGIQL